MDAPQKLIEGALVDKRDSRRVDVVIVDRAHTVMRQLLWDCLDEPMNRRRLEATTEVQQMLLDDVSAAAQRLATP